ncbi:MAG TPA: TolC family outer membrane protein [Roseomonas sp.]|jgi:outer membrane protein
MTHGRLTRGAGTSILFLCLALAALSPAARAQTLQQALAQAYNANPALLAARAQLRAVDEAVPQALSGWRPSVTITGSYGATDARSRTRMPGAEGQPFSTFRDTSIAPATGAVVLSQPLFQGGRTTAATAQAESQVLAQRARLLATEQLTLLNAVQAYVDVVRGQEVLRLNDNNLRVLEQQRIATERRLRAGEVTRTDSLQAEARLALAIGSREAAAAALESSRAAYQRFVGAPPGTLVAPQPLRPVAPTERALREAAGTEGPAVAAALFDAAAARHAVRVQAAQLLPQLSLQAQVFRNDNSGLRGSRGTGQSAGVTLSVPIYQGGAEYASVRQARELEQQALQLLDDQRRQAMQQGTDAWHAWQAAGAQADAARRAIRAAEGALYGVQREALIGGRTTLDVLNAELELLNARIAQVQAVATLVTSSYALAASVGRLTAAGLGLPVTPYDWTTHYHAVRNSWIGLGN